MARMYFFEIAGETPAKKNSRINTKKGTSFPSRRHSAWHNSALLQLRRQDLPPSPIDYPVLVHVQFVHGDLIRRDSDNACSSVLDLLKDAGVIADDKWQIVKDIAICNQYEKGKPVCYVTVQEL